MDTRCVARGLGWFSLALGAPELLAPRRISEMLGVREHDGLIRSDGLCELGAGVELLAAARPAPWLWARVAGVTALDVAAASRSSGEAESRNAA